MCCYLSGESVCTVVDKRWLIYTLYLLYIRSTLVTHKGSYYSFFWLLLLWVGTANHLPPCHPVTSIITPTLGMTFTILMSLHCGLPLLLLFYIQAETSAD